MAAPSNRTRPSGDAAGTVAPPHRQGLKRDLDESTSADILKSHFDRAVSLLEQQAKLRADLVEWRKQARSEGLDPAVLFKLAREHLRDAEQRRKAAAAAEIEELYRQGLGLPLFEHASLAS
jgi:uncharacterized protein (UPF0335 family)